MFRYEYNDDYKAVKEGDYAPIEIYTGVGHPVSAVQIGGTHYKDMQITPREYAIANRLGVDEFNVIKYVSRHKSKNGLEDINKAIHYLEMLKADVYERYGEQ